jgi:hypothetical protein
MGTAGLGAGALVLMAATGGAIDVDLRAAAIQKLIEEGKQMKVEDIKNIPTRFGADLSKDLCGGGGYLETKTLGLTRYGARIAADPAGAEQNKEQVEAAIKKLAESKRLKIVFDFCGDTADFAEEAQATLEQDGKLIKGEMAKPDKARKNPEGPAYRGKIAASFAYDAFDPKKVTKISLYPKMGDALTWEVDFSKIR